MPAHFPRSEDLPESHPLHELRNRYLEGRCHYLALALAEQTGLELGVLWDYEEEPVPLHVFCCASLEGPAVDAYGVVDDPWELLAYFDQEWNLARPEDPDISLVSRQELLLLFCDGEEPDPEQMAKARSALIKFGLGPTPRPELGGVEAPPVGAPAPSSGELPLER